MGVLQTYNIYNMQTHSSNSTVSSVQHRLLAENLVQWKITVYNHLMHTRYTRQHRNMTLNMQVIDLKRQNSQRKHIHSIEGSVGPEAPPLGCSLSPLPICRKKGNSGQPNLLEILTYWRRLPSNRLTFALVMWHGWLFFFINCLSFLSKLDCNLYSALEESFGPVWSTFHAASQPNLGLRPHKLILAGWSMGKNYPIFLQLGWCCSWSGDEPRAKNTPGNSKNALNKLYM